jgi:hypothetical protein
MSLYCLGVRGFLRQRDMVFRAALIIFNAISPRPGIPSRAAQRSKMKSVRVGATDIADPED